MADDFVGSGWAFPLRANDKGGIALVSREREIEQAMHLILGTSFGERPMRPEFGCGIHDHVFDESNAVTAGVVAREVRASLDRWEPRADVADVVVTFDQSAQGLMYIDITYTIKGTNDRRNLVFPFYSIPEGGEDEGTAAISAPPRLELVAS
jgi:uncharacterized protein